MAGLDKVRIHGYGNIDGNSEAEKQINSMIIRRGFLPRLRVQLGPSPETSIVRDIGGIIGLALDSTAHENPKTVQLLVCARKFVKKFFLHMT